MWGRASKWPGRLAKKIKNPAKEQGPLAFCHSPPRKLPKYLLQGSRLAGLIAFRRRETGEINSGMEPQERRSPQRGATVEPETHARGNRADDRNIARNGDAAVRGDEEAPDRALEWLHAGDSEHGGAARHRESQLGTVVSYQLSVFSETSSAPAAWAPATLLESLQTGLSPAFDMFYSA